MASIIHLRRRIKTAKNIAQLTKAMEMVATSKMRRARQKTLASRPYKDKLFMITTNLSSRISKEETHPFLRQGNEGKTLMIVFAPDRGLCGALISNLFREFANFYQKEKNIRQDLVVVTVGKKLTQKIIKTGARLLADFPFGTNLPSFEMVIQIRTLVEDEFLKGYISKVVCLYTKLESVFSQKPQLSTILPVSFESGENRQASEDLPYLFEPSASFIQDSLLPHYLEIQLFQMLLESYASEQVARSTAMHNATENAKEVVDILTLEFNKVRQEKVTNEILDITTASLSLGL